MIPTKSNIKWEENKKPYFDEKSSRGSSSEVYLQEANHRFK